MKRKIIKRLNQIMVEILKADEEGLNKIGVELLEIEKQLMMYDPRLKAIQFDKLKKL